MTRNRVAELLARYPFSAIYVLICLTAVALALILERHL